jgi:hypothetical protein
MKAIITKSYSRKLSGKDFTSEEFFTSVEKEIEYNTKEEYLAEHDKLAAQVKSLTLRDLEKYSEVLKTVRSNEPAMVTERAS